MDSKVVCSLGQFADDKSAFRLKHVNALNYVKPGYGKAVDKLNECIDRGEDPGDVRPGVTLAWSAAHVGKALVESLREVRGEGFGTVDVEQLGMDLEFIVTGNAKPKADTRQRIISLQNLAVCDVTHKSAYGSRSHQDRT